jgi:sulfur transfer protein SufE
MKFWNDIDGSIFFNQIFKTAVAIGLIELFTINIENNRPTTILEFDIEELPDAPPSK